MKSNWYIISVILFLVSCSAKMETKSNKEAAKTFTETDILNELNLAFNQMPGSFFPAGNPDDIKYNFFLDLEHGYCETAGNRIHLYGDSTRWAIVFEKSGYQNRGSAAEIELNYVGNCIDYPIDKYPERNYITNSSGVVLITSDEYERICNKTGSDMEQFELISPDAKQVNIRNAIVQIEHDPKKYEAVGIKIRKEENPRRLIGFGDLIRYLHEMNHEIISATEDEIKKHIPKNLPKIMTINEFHFVNAYEKDNPPGNQEMYQQIAKVLVNRDSSFWKPTLKSNNHWTNWESGNL